MSSAMPSILWRFLFFLLYPRFLFQIYIRVYQKQASSPFFHPESGEDARSPSWSPDASDNGFFPFQEINQWVVLGYFSFYYTLWMPRSGLPASLPHIFLGILMPPMA